MLEINYVCPLGLMCQSAQILKRNKYKLLSYPFDWIFSNCDNIIHCLEDDFQIFLDKSYYISESNTQCGHSKYYDFMFNHFNPLINADHYNYYVRCVDRFRNLLQKQEHKLFIMIFTNNDSMDETFMNKMIDFNKQFSKYTSNYTLLVIFHIPNKQIHHEFTYVDNIHFLEIHTVTGSGGVEFVNNDENVYLDNIINSYNFKLF